MRALYIKNNNVSLVDYQLPQPKEADTKIKILASGICSTDLQLIHGYKNFIGIPGHEFVGQVVDCPDLNLIGKRVTGEINIACQKCIYCQNNMASHCENRRVLGILDYPGTHTEYISLPYRNLHTIPDEIPTEQGIFIEPLAAAYQILQQISISSQQKILVIGDGKLGLLITLVLASENKNVHILGKYKSKLDLLSHWHHVPQYTLEHHQLKPKSFEIVVECTGNSEGLEIAKKIVIPRGKIILKSTYSQNLNINISDIIVNEIEIIGSRCGPFPPAIKFLSKHNLLPLIEARYPLSKGVEAYQHAQKKGMLKIVILN